MAYVEGFYGPLEEVSQGDSPIEKMMFLALSITAGIDGTTVQINTQQRIGDYRVDFHILAMDSCGACRTKFERSVIVECDGHDFHERTKEQASRDKKRDRYLQQQGFTVFRFTGSDIWKDVFSCSSEVTDFLREQIQDMGMDHWRFHHMQGEK